jgi:hypothetical protein
MRREKLRTVDIIVYPGFKALEAIGPLRVFDYTNSCLQQRNLTGGYEVAIASTKRGKQLSVESDCLADGLSKRRKNASCLSEKNRGNAQGISRAFFNCVMSKPVACN